MAVKQVSFRVPPDLAERLQTVPRKFRNTFGIKALEKAIAEHEADLAKIAAAVTAEEINSPKLQEETSAWSTTTADGIEEHAPRNADTKAR